MLFKLPWTEFIASVKIPINSCFVLRCYLHQLWKSLNSPFRVFRWILVQSADWHAVGWSCSVAACHITVSSCQICFDRFQSLGCVFSNCQGVFSFFLNGLCVGVPFSEMSYCFIGLWISVEAKGRGQKFSELQEEGQSTSSVQVLKGQCTKLSRRDLFGCCNMKLKKGSVNVLPLTKPL